MEGRTAACAHLSPVGNIAQAACDCWSNESVQNVRLLSTNAPTVCLEQLAYDCRLMNTALSHSPQDARTLRDWLADSNASLDPQAYVLRPDVVLRISRDIMEESTPYKRTRKAVLVSLAEIAQAHQGGALRLSPRELNWLQRLQHQANELPEDEAELIAEFKNSPRRGPFPAAGIRPRIKFSFFV